MNTQAQIRRPWGAAMATVLTFLALGPPIGAMVFVLLISVVPGFALMSMPDDKGVADIMAGSFAVMLFALPLSYVLGGVQAGVTGVLLAIYGWTKGRPTLLFALLIGLLVFALSYWMNFGGLLSESGYIWQSMFITQIAATILCWLIARMYWRSPQ
jgi:hypothetical protein